MKTENIVLIVVLAIIAVIVIYNLVKKEEYYMPHINEKIYGNDFNNDLELLAYFKREAESKCKNEFRWDGKTVKKAGCDDSISYQKSKRRCNSVYCDVNVDLLKSEQPEIYQKWKGWL